MFEILSYTFFQKALIAGLIISLISGTLGSLVVLRREPNITHSIANILFLGIVVSFFFSGNYYFFGILFAILWVFLLRAIEKYTATSRESSKEIISQLGLAGGIFGIGLLWNIQIDIFNFLFGSILFVTTTDIYMLCGMFVFGGIIWYFFWKKLLRVALSREIAQSQWINTNMYEMGYLLYLALFIAVALKIFGVLLLGAFLVLPWNISKIFSQSLFGVCISSTLIAMTWVIIGLFASYFFDTSAGASIVLILGIMFLGAGVLMRVRER